MSRTVPTTGTDRQRLATVAANLFLPNEVHTTSDQHRAFVGGIYLLSSGVYLGSVSNETAMRALNTSNVRGCFPGDECFRSDTGSFWKCITNRGALLADWKEFTIIVTTAAADVTYDHTSSGLAASNVQDAIDELAASSGGTSNLDIRDVWLFS